MTLAAARARKIRRGVGHNDSLKSFLEEARGPESEGSD